MISINVNTKDLFKVGSIVFVWTVTNNLIKHEANNYIGMNNLLPPSKYYMNAKQTILVFASFMYTAYILTK